MTTKSSLRRTWANINLDALEHNYHKLQEHMMRALESKPGASTSSSSSTTRNATPDASQPATPQSTSTQLATSQATAAQPAPPASTPQFLGVVKADAYGHGAVHVGRTLQDLGARYLAVSSLDEAMELRENGITMPILILGHTPRDQVKTLIDYDITQAVSCRAKALNYSNVARTYDRPLRIHIKVDTGMSRLGFLCAGEHFSDGVFGIGQACDLPGLEAEGIFTHFAVSDENEPWCKDYTLEQFALFERVVQAVEDMRGQKFVLRHCANSGAVADYPQTYMDMVRPGILLYGIGDIAERLGLRPVMTVKSAVQTIKHYDANTRVSYGGTFTTADKTRLGVLPYGYADGFPRALSNKCSVIALPKTLECAGDVAGVAKPSEKNEPSVLCENKNITTSDNKPAREGEAEHRGESADVASSDKKPGGGFAPVRGKICMDMCMIDLSGLPEVNVGDEVEIFGEHNSVNELAKIAGTIPYELVCNVSKRVPRYYYRKGKLIDKELLLRFE